MAKPVTLTPVGATNLSETVYEVLRNWIIEQNFQPGERLNLNLLEDHLQVSRTPLKTALKRLELEGLVEIHPRSGTYIANTTPDKLDEAYKIRSSFELYVALCLFKYLTPEDYAFFDNLQQQMNHLVDGGADWAAIAPDYLDLDRQFHERLVAVGGPPRMLDMFKQMNVHVQMSQIVSRYQSRDAMSVHFEHEQIFAAIQDRSPERLNASLLNHLEAARYRARRYSADDSDQSGILR